MWRIPFLALVHVHEALRLDEEPVNLPTYKFPQNYLF